MIFGFFRKIIVKRATIFEVHFERNCSTSLSSKMVVFMQGCQGGRVIDYGSVRFFAIKINNYKSFTSRTRSKKETKTCVT
jgi:hypothetical protein